MKDSIQKIKSINISDIKRLEFGWYNSFERNIRKAGLSALDVFFLKYRSLDGKDEYFLWNLCCDVIPIIFERLEIELNEKDVDFLKIYKETECTHKKLNCECHSEFLNFLKFYNVRVEYVDEIDKL